LISTADSAAIAIVFSLSEGVLLPSFDVKSQDWSSQRKVYSLSSLVIVVVLFAAFFFFQYGARSSFLHLIFAFFNLLVPLFPVVYYLIQDERVSLRDKHKRLSKSDEFRASIGIASGVIAVIALTVTGIYVGSLAWTQLGSVAAVLTTPSISSSVLKA
jgi:hypothetical protein